MASSLPRLTVNISFVSPSHPQALEAWPEFLLLLYLSPLYRSFPLGYNLDIGLRIAPPLLQADHKVDEAVATERVMSVLAPNEAKGGNDRLANVVHDPLTRSTFCFSFFPFFFFFAFAFLLPDGLES